MKTNKEKFIEEVKAVMYHQLHDHFITDIDAALKPMLEDIDLDFDDYNEARRKGKIVRIDHYLVMWLNGTLLGWELSNYPETTPVDAVKVQQDDIIPDFQQVADRSRTIANNDNYRLLGEYCRLTDINYEADIPSKPKHQKASQCDNDQTNL